MGMTTGIIEARQGWQPTRRTLVRGAAWTVPVIAVAAAAPAFAASPCDVQNYRLDWGNTTGQTVYGKNSTTNVGTAVVKGSAGGGALMVTFTSTTTGSVSRAVDNLTVSNDTNIGNLGTGAQGLNVAHNDGITAGRANRQMIDIQFDRAVTGLSFSITDIDSQRGNNLGTKKDPVYEGWYDRVELSGTRTASTAGGSVIGAGTNTNENTSASGPWRHSDTDTNVPNTGSSDGNVTVTYAGTIAANTPITLTYWSTLSAGNQRIFLSDMTFSAKGC